MSITSYDLIFDRFLSKITDYELEELLDDEIQEQLLKYLKSAISDFKYCVQDLSNRDDEKLQFNFLLNEVEQEILAKFMLVHWITPHILRLENIKNDLGNKDFRTYSPANFLEKMTNLKQLLISEANSEMVFYYYST